MTRYVVTATTTVAGSGYTSPARTLRKGEVLELSASEVSAISGSNLRAVTTSTMHDQLGESAGCSNGS
ncbi:MAG TPA: hypothetical protein VGH54_06170 [Mycobacterium sp.]|uniref:hypothetical protein n=1 Tax=Mycobacterium sp. TaxID=1785 RepID=UPI002F3E58A5